MPSRINIGPENGPFVAINESSGNLQLEDNSGNVVAEWDETNAQWDFANNTVNNVDALDSNSVNTNSIDFDDRPYNNTEELTIYLDDTGGDDNNDGTSESEAFATWDRVFEEIPRRVTNDVEVVVVGDYDGEIYLEGSFAESWDADFLLRGDTSDADNHEITGGLTLRSLFGRFRFEGLEFGRKVSVRDCQIEEFRDCHFNEPGGRAIDVGWGGASFRGGEIVDADIGVMSTNRGFVRTNDLSGSADSYGLEAKGGVLCHEGEHPTGGVQDKRQRQGGVFGAGERPVDPTRIKTRKVNDSQSITAGERAKVEFDNTARDRRSEYDEDNDVFVPDQTGWYEITANVQLVSGGSSDRIELTLRDTETESVEIRSELDGVDTSGAVTIHLNQDTQLSSGTEYALYIENQDNDDTVWNGNGVTNMSIKRDAN